MMIERSGGRHLRGGAGFRSIKGLLATTAVAGLVLAGCTSTASNPSPSGSASAGSASATPSAAPLTDPGQARAAVKALLAAAGTRQVVKVDITATEASLSIVRDGKPLTWAWSNGTVAPASSDIANVQQASFDPATFDIDDVGSLFRQAAAVTRSSSNQELQIVEYNEGQVLMTVTTNPESGTVFFRSDGSMVNTVNFGSTDGIAEALKDCLNSTTSVVAVGYKPSSGLYVQVAGSQSGTLSVTTRPANLPRWTATVKGTAYPSFDAALVQPAIIATILGDLRSPSASASASTVASGSASGSMSASASAASTSVSGSSASPSTATTASSTSASASASVSTSVSAASATGSATSASPATGTSESASQSASTSASASSSGLVQPDISWVIDRRDTYAAQPVMRFTVNGQTREYTVSGTDVTALYSGS